MEIIRHEIDTKHGGRPPFDHYFTLPVLTSGVELQENQALSCVTVMETGTSDAIHICDVPVFIAALQEFQAHRAGDPRYQ